MRFDRGPIAAAARRAGLQRVVVGLLRNAGDNGHAFAGWPNAAVLGDMRNCTDALGDFTDEEVMAALVEVRGGDKPCPYCTGAPCENCMGYGEVRP